MEGTWPYVVLSQPVLCLATFSLFSFLLQGVEAYCFFSPEHSSTLTYSLFIFQNSIQMLQLKGALDQDLLKTPHHMLS